MKLIKRLGIGAAGVSAAVVMPFLALTGTAHATTAHMAAVAKSGTFYFNSDSANVNSGDNTIRATPFSPNSVFPDASQALTTAGVTLSATGESDSGVIYPLGHLSSLFDSNGQFVAPVIDGTGLKDYNLYFDTNGDGTFFGYPATSAAAFTYSAFDGDNKCALGAVNVAAPQVSCDGTWGGNNASTTAIPNAAANEPYTMTQVKAFFAANTTGDTDPLVWAWIGVGDNSSGTVTATVTSIDGTNLVNDTTGLPAPQAPVLSAGNAVSNANTRETVSWKSTVTPGQWDVTIVGPGPLNGRTNLVTSPKAVYTGLETGHNYSVTIQQLVHGAASGKAGKVSFLTK